MHIIDSPSDSSEPRMIGRKRERTRAALIRCATEIVGEKGFEGATLEEIAQRAGMTRGAIYGNFKSREELFLAVAESLWEPVMPQPEQSASLSRQMEILAEAVIAELPNRRRKAVGAASFIAYALKHSELRKEIESSNAAGHRRATEVLKNALPSKESVDLPSRFVPVVHALIEGLFLLHSLTPKLIDEGAIRQAFQIVAKGSN